VVCVSDDAVLKANLLSSPGLTGPGSPHEVILLGNVNDGPGSIALAGKCLRHGSNTSAAMRMSESRDVK
jgi:hypothetical protein